MCIKETPEEEINETIRKILKIITTQNKDIGYIGTIKINDQKIRIYILNGSVYQPTNERGIFNLHVKIKKVDLTKLNYYQLLKIINLINEKIDEINR